MLQRSQNPTCYSTGPVGGGGSGASSYRTSIAAHPSVCVGLGAVLFDAVAGINRMFDDKKLHRLGLCRLLPALCLFMATGD